MQFRMTKVAAAVATGLGVSVVGMEAAQADALMFPYVVGSPSTTTIISVINTARPINPLLPQYLHYRTYYKVGAASTADDAGNNNACEEYDVRRLTSKNDVVTFDLNRKYGDSQSVLHEGASTKVPNAEPFDLLAKAIDQKGGSTPQARGVLIVSNEYLPTTLNSDSHEGSLFGEALIISHSTGAAWGYTAYNAAPTANIHEVNADARATADHRQGRSITIPDQRLIDRGGFPFAHVDDQGNIGYDSGDRQIPVHNIGGRIYANAGEDFVRSLGGLDYLVYAHPALAYDFSDRAETQGEVLAGDPGNVESHSPPVPVVIPPFNTGDSDASPDDAARRSELIFFVTPIAHNALQRHDFSAEESLISNAVNLEGNQVAPSETSLDSMLGYQLLQDKLVTRVAFKIEDYSGNALDVVFDRDETPVSGTTPKSVRCVGVIRPADLISSGVQREWSKNGGWTAVTVSSPGALLAGNSRFVGGVINTNQAIIQKLELREDGTFYNGEAFSGLAGFEDGEGNTAPGAYNNAVWLKAPGISRESIRPRAEDLVTFENDTVRNISSVKQSSELGGFSTAKGRLKTYSFEAGGRTGAMIIQDTGDSYPPGMPLAGGNGVSSAQ